MSISPVYSVWVHKLIHSSHPSTSPMTYMYTSNGASLLFVADDRCTHHHTILACVATPYLLMANTGTYMQTHYDRIIKVLFCFNYKYNSCKVQACTCTCMFLLHAGPLVWLKLPAVWTCCFSLRRLNALLYWFLLIAKTPEEGKLYYG